MVHAFDGVQYVRLNSGDINALNEFVSSMSIS